MKTNRGKYCPHFFLAYSLQTFLKTLGTIYCSKLISDLTKKENAQNVQCANDKNIPAKGRPSSLRLMSRVFLSGSCNLVSLAAQATAAERFT